MIKKKFIPIAKEVIGLEIKALQNLKRNINIHSTKQLWRLQNVSQR